MKNILIALLVLSVSLSADEKSPKAELTEKDYNELVEKLSGDSSKTRKQARISVGKLNKVDLKALLNILKASKDPELTELVKELTVNEPDEKGWLKTKSGLKYKILIKGEGKKPNVKSKVTVHYEGKLPGGKNFDSSIERGQPATFPLSGVIKGWTEGLQLMPTGAKTSLRFHPNWLMEQVALGIQYLRTPH
jgi:FKBP-type peptidyl-prolyl cis-trans isomerase